MAFTPPQNNAGKFPFRMNAPISGWTHQDNLNAKQTILWRNTYRECIPREVAYVLLKIGLTVYILKGQSSSKDKRGR